jgi:type IX secretion system PorP/SprF family membrane protein
MLFCQLIQAQDFHYTQFYNAPFAISPGLTGVFKEDVRIHANYRRQWAVRSSGPVYETHSVAADLKLWPNRSNSNGFFALGLSLNRDQAGLAKLTLLNLGLNASYTHRLTEHAFLTAGLQGSLNQKRFDISRLSFNEQFDPDGGFDPDTATGETNFNKTSNYFGLGLGLNLRLQRLSERMLVDATRCRNKMDLGFGISNLNQPDQSFEEDLTVRLPRRFTPYVLSYVQLGASKWDLAVNLIGQFQQKYSEMLGVLGFRYHLSQKPGDWKAIQLSGAARFSDNQNADIDAIVPVLELFVNEWRFGISVDVTVSDANTALTRAGGLEFSARYAITKVKLPSPNCCWIL